MKLYVALADALTIITPSHGEWVAQMHLADQEPQCLAVDPLHQEQVYCGTFDQGLWLSRDAGKSWTPVGVGEGIAHEKVLSVAVSATERVKGYSVVYAGTEPTALFRSEDRSGNLTRSPLHADSALMMVKARAIAAGLPQSTCCFRGR